MLIAIISLLIALGLRKLGVNIPYFDNIIYATKMKIAELKFNKIQQPLNKIMDKPPIRGVSIKQKNIKNPYINPLNSINRKNLNSGIKI